MSQKGPTLSNAPPAEQRVFGCVRGHQFEAPAPLTLSFGFRDGAAQTGPLCPECVVAALNHLAAAVELAS